MKARYVVAAFAGGALSGVTHPAVLVASGALTGAGASVAALIRLRDARAEATALVVDWLGHKAHRDETVADVCRRFSTIKLVEIAEQRRAYLFEQGYDAAVEDEHERRSLAARRAAATRHGYSS